MAEGEVFFFIGEESSRLGPGDRVAVPSDRPQRIQPLAPTARRIDTFTPLRQGFL